MQQPKPVRTRQDLPIVEPDRLADDDEYRYALLDTLAAQEAWADTEVALHARHLHAGAVARKPSGEYTYTRVDTRWLYKTLGVETDRVLCVGEGGTVQLWSADDIVITTLENAVGSDSDFLHALNDMVCPQ